MRRPPADFIFAAVILAMMVLAALIGWARSAHAEQCWKIEGCPSIVAQEISCPPGMNVYNNTGVYGCMKPQKRPDCHTRATKEYAELAATIGLPEVSPMFHIEQRDYVSAVCLHELMEQR